jgi:hypothetical protein
MESLDKKLKPTAQQRVDAWNRSVPVGAEVTYLKSEIEGRIILKTAGIAYVCGDDAAVVELEHIGIALLTKVEPFYQ